MAVQDRPWGRTVRSLFPTMRHGKLTGRQAMAQAVVYRMIRRQATAAGIATKISRHSFRATGITVYLHNGGKLDRRNDVVALDEVERVVF